MIGHLVAGIGWRLPAALIVALALMGATLWHIVHYAEVRRLEAATAFRNGENAERAMWVAAVDKERQRQSQASQLALQAAQERIAALEAERDDLNQALEDLSDAADKVADANRACLDPGVMRRLDAIR